MSNRIVRFIQDVVFFGTGRFVLRAVSLGRLHPNLNERSPWVIFLGALATIGAIAGAGVWLDLSSNPHADDKLFHGKAACQDYVSRLDLASVATPIAIERLASQGFRCEIFTDGNVACFRETGGSLCGERQFVDLLVPGRDGAAHAVSTRFGRVCL